MPATEKAVRLMAKKDGKATIVIRREEVVEGGHHGGAWKVAYADFVTAMMAFFLLMWLLNATTEAQRRGIADYFSPVIGSSRSPAGQGGPFGGHTPYDHGPLLSDQGALAVMNAKAPPTNVEDDDSDTPAQTMNWREPGRSEVPPDADGSAARPAAGPGGPGSGSPAEASTDGVAQRLLTEAHTHADPGKTADAQIAARNAAQAAAQERAAFKAAAVEIRQTLEADPAYAELSHQLSVDMTRNGLRVQILDEDAHPMFATGSAAVNDRARLLLRKIAPVLLRLPEQIAITGHTDAAPYRGGERSNWELSAERANATRRVLAEAGLPESRIRSVTGDADRDLLLPATPLAAANRRIAITVLREAPGRASDPAAAPGPVPAMAAAVATAEVVPGSSFQRPAAMPPASR